MMTAITLFLFLRDISARLLRHGRRQKRPPGIIAGFFRRYFALLLWLSALCLFLAHFELFYPEAWVIAFYERFFQVHSWFYILAFNTMVTLPLWFAKELTFYLATHPTQDMDGNLGPERIDMRPTLWCTAVFWVFGVVLNPTLPFLQLLRS